MLLPDERTVVVAHYGQYIYLCYDGMSVLVFCALQPLAYLLVLSQDKRIDVCEIQPTHIHFVHVEEPAASAAFLRLGLRRALRFVGGGMSQCERIDALRVIVTNVAG